MLALPCYLYRSVKMVVTQAKRFSAYPSHGAHQAQSLQHTAESIYLMVYRRKKLSRLNENSLAVEI